jgi:glutathionyl-hydroquinone reductase
MGEDGWSFGSGHDIDYLASVYLGADPKYTGKITVPVLWDNRLETIVNNESADIIRILNYSFNNLTESTIDLYPQAIRTEIDAINDRIYADVNDGVYKTGFAASQEAYEKNFKALFNCLEELDVILSQSKYLVGDRLTEADIRFFTTLIRFDPVYYLHFKCNFKMIREYQNLHNYLKSLYQIPEIRMSCHFDHIKEHYYRSHSWLNPSKIVPLGPAMDLDSPHGRGKPEFYHLTPDVN